MTGSGGDPPPLPPANGGEFLLSLLQRQNNNNSQTHTHPPPQSQQPPLLIGQTVLTQQHQQPPLVHDPAVAAFGPTIGFQSAPGQFNGLDFPPTTTHFHWPNSFSPPLNSNLLGFPQYPFNQLSTKQFPGNQALLTEDFQRLGFGGNANHVVNNNLVQQNFQQQEPPKLVFGSFQNDSIQRLDVLLNRNVIDNSSATEDRELRNRKFGSSNTSSESSPSLFQHRNSDSRELEQRDRVAWENHHRRVNQSVNYNSMPLTGFPSNHGGGRNLDFGGSSSNIKAVGYNADRGAADRSELSYKGIHLAGNERVRGSTVNNGNGVGLSGQLDHPGPPAGSNLASVSARDIEKSQSTYHSEVLEHGVREKTERECKTQRETSSSGHGGDGSELDDFGEELVESLLLEDEAVEKDDKKQHRNSRDKEFRKDNRGQRFLSQRVRNIRRQMVCRHDIHRFNGPFLAIFESLNPPEEEKTKQKQLLTLLEKLVRKEWPEARLYLYGSCANSFGVSKSDIDVCLTINDPDVNKSEILLKLAEVLESDNLQNVQALTRARVPIVKLMDPVTQISCDICINNVLAVVNTKLLHDYARIDERLRQLAFIVKHWAKSRGVNETYQGTLSSYAYVLMCIHFLQQCSPAILPCLQGMRATYSVTVDGIKCDYFDQVDKLRNFGSHNKETISQLVWGFFVYWAYCHDYANEVISVRTGSIISKQEKNWTRRVGNDRHLICIEDPFEITHDLGRVVDKYSIKVLREEFERAADVMQYAPNPFVTLFEPYISS